MEVSGLGDPEEGKEMAVQELHRVNSEKAKNRMLGVVSSEHEWSIGTWTAGNFPASLLLAQLWASFQLPGSRAEVPMEAFLLAPFSVTFITVEMTQGKIQAHVANQEILWSEN